VVGIFWRPNHYIRAPLHRAYDAAGLTVLTWGSTQKATWPWSEECVDEAYAILPPEATDTSFRPGFNFAQLKADLQAVAN